MEEDSEGIIGNWFEIIAINYNQKELGVLTKEFETEFFPVENLMEIVTEEMMESISYKVTKM